MVALLDRIMGDRSSFKLEERLFHFYTFLGCLFCLSGLIPNTLTGMSPYLNFVTALLGFSFGLVYWFSRSKKSSAKHLILPHCLLTTVLLPILFLLNGGIVSSIPIDIVSVVQYFALVIQPRWITLILFLGIIVAYFILDLFHLSWIIPYPNEFSQKIDIYLTLLFMGLITFGACSILLREYDRERGLLINKTKELEDYKKELEQLNLLEIKAQELAKLGYWELDLNTNKIKWSEGTYKIFDRDPNLGVLTLENLMNMVHPDDRQKMEQLFQKAVVEGIPYNLEKGIILENGKTKTVKVITEVGKDENDRVVKLFGVIQDITDRKQMEDKLRHNQAILAEAQRIAKVGYWEYNLADSSIAWSEQTFIIFGFAPDQKTPSWSEVEQRIHPDDRELHSKVLEEAISQGRPYKIELRIILPDNSRRYVEAIAKMEIVDGKTVKLFGSVLDITDRKLMEQELRNSEAKYRLIVENQTDFVLRSLPDTTIIYGNQSLLKALGGDSSQVIGKKWSDFVPYDYLIPLENKIKSLSVENPTFINVNPDIRGDGTIGWTEWVNLGIFDQYGKLKEIQSVGRDITDRKLTEQALEKSKKQLLEAQRIAHLGSWELDFKTNNGLGHLNYLTSMVLIQV
jgi:PAS domain S-box-containing protein